MRNECGASLTAALMMALMACGSSGKKVPPTGDGGGDAGSGTGGGVPLTVTGGYNLQGFVDSTGPYSNLYSDRIDVYGGSPTAAGYTWSIVLGPGLPDTVTIDPATGGLNGTLAANFVPGPPCRADFPYTIYD